MALYQGLSHKPVTFQHLEEFLVALGQKEPVMLSAEQPGENCAYRGPATQGNTVSV